MGSIKEDVKYFQHKMWLITHSFLDKKNGKVSFDKTFSLPGIFHITFRFSSLFSGLGGNIMENTSTQKTIITIKQNVKG